MRRYEREEFRHLDDGERYRDYDYLADDAWIGPNERVPHGLTREDEPPWGQPGHPRPPGAEERRFASGGERGEGGLRARSHPHDAGADLGRWRPMRSLASSLTRAVRHPFEVARRLRGMFAGRGPKNWVRPDARIHDEVCARIAEHPPLDAREIEVTVEHGEVTLGGTVPDRRTKYLAEDVADGVHGVWDVHNRLRVKGR